MKYQSEEKDWKFVHDDSDVIFENHGTGHKVILNRPKKLNSLTVSIIEKLFNFYLSESQSSESNLFIQKSTIPKAFCAGGDVVALAKFDYAGHPDISIRMLRQEYSLNYFYSKFKKPVVSIMNGITMGGGVGLTIHTPFRVVTEATKLTMPEMAIGFFPDVGATWFFSRMDGYLGWYICLTGDLLVGYDNLFAGTGTHYVPSAKLAGLENALVDASKNYKNFNTRDVKDANNEWFLKVNDIINGFAEAVPKDYRFSYTSVQLKIIHDMFHQSTTIEQVFDFLGNLAKQGNSFAVATLKKFNQRSLLSIKISYKILTSASKVNNYQGLEDELNLCKNMNLNGAKTDLQEGVFKKLVFKTNDPDWLFKDIHNIPDDYVEQVCFKPIEAFGHIHRFKDNFALFEDSLDYKLNFYGLPNYKTVLEAEGQDIKSKVESLKKQFPPFKSKKGLEDKVRFVLNQSNDLKL